MDAEISAQPSGPGTGGRPAAPALTGRRFDARTLDLIDFPAIRARLAGLCGGPLGVRQAEALEPAGQRREVARRLAETDEARLLLDAGELPPAGGIEDVTPQLGRARRGGTLDGRELLAVAAVAATCRRVRGFFGAGGRSKAGGEDPGPRGGATGAVSAGRGATGDGGQGGGGPVGRGATGGATGAVAAGRGAAGDGGPGGGRPGTVDRGATGGVTGAASAGRAAAVHGGPGDGGPGGGVTVDRGATGGATGAVSAGRGAAVDGGPGAGGPDGGPGGGGPGTVGRGAAGGGGTPLLADWASRLEAFPRLEAEIARCIDEEGGVRDQASARLGDLRRQQRAVQARVRERLDAMLRSAAVQPYLQEPLVTQRSDRFVLPVRVEHRQQVPGIVHDQSASGATVFIEPMAVVEANNELRRLAGDERAEVERILAELSALAGEAQPAMLPCLEILGHIDVAVAKARLSAALDGRAPALDAEPGLDFRRARHPLLANPVPLDLRLGTALGGFRALVVSGPNTGGKTVALKTAGLLVCMAQAGLHVPAADGSRLGPFPQVLCDAGDEQGVAQNLSTFSSHMTQIVRFLDGLPPGSLVLLDELGAGTDPAEGAALGTALIERLLERGACIVATTHYSELIAFAYRHPEAENASVEFDAATLRPTYRLIIGLPGRSNALAIAARLGLEEGVVERARDLLHPGQRHVESLIAGMAADERRIAEALAAAEDGRREAERLLRASSDRAARTEAGAAARVEAARHEAEQVLRAARDDADRIVRELRRRLAEADRRSLEEAEALRLEARERLATVAPAVRRSVAPGPPPPGGWRAGQTAFVHSVGQVGVLLEDPGGSGHVPVQIGALRVSARVADLGPADPQAPDEPASPVRLVLRPAAFEPFNPECDLRGLTVSEATDRVDRFLDEAALAGCARVRLVHGKGTGALRRAVAEFLHGHSQVAAFRVEMGSTEVDVKGV